MKHNNFEPIRLNFYIVIYTSNIISKRLFSIAGTRTKISIMRNYQEDIPPWKKEVLMRGDGLSKAVENESMTGSEENINNPSDQISGSKQPVRYRIGSNSSFMSKVKSFFSETKDREENNNELMPNIKRK